MYTPALILLFPFWVMGIWWLVVHVPTPLLVGWLVATVLWFMWRDYRDGIL